MIDVGPNGCTCGFNGDCNCPFVPSAASEETISLSALQRESARVNDLNGVVAFCAGVFDRILQCKSLDEAKTCAEMGAQSLEERHAGLWQPGPHDDPADWRPA